MNTSELITTQHLARQAVIYIRQSTQQQTLTNKESNERFNNNNNTNGYQNFLQKRQNYHQNQLNAANAASVAVSFFSNLFKKNASRPN